jgi:hypothetical protein
MTDKADEREQFEAWCGAERYRFVPLNRTSGDRYVHPGVQADWEVWQARATYLSASPESLLYIAATALLREALDDVQVHPCDVNDDEVSARGLYGRMADLYAALKAQPAPTEAPCQHRYYGESACIDCGKVLSDPIQQLVDQAQELDMGYGKCEDSVRLDAERYRYFRKIYGAETRLIRGPIYVAETPEQLDSGIDECMRYEQEVARASAETGGVKS